MAGYSYSAVTDVGNVRDHNEDSYVVDEDLGLFVVADGMGGHAAGEVASEIAVETIAQQVVHGISVNRAIDEANEAILAAVEDARHRYGMGTTVVAVNFNGAQYRLAWVGDSRGYLFDRKAETPLTQLTTDHSYVQMLLQAGLITDEEAENHPSSNLILQNLGNPEIEAVTADVVTGTLKPGQWLLLCSDGLNDEVSEEEIGAIMSVSATPEQATSALVQSALAGAGRDNITVIVVGLA